ncbi:hypothetical protein J1N35_008115 [Gossypium stocksii]|uniref:RING-type E3 ubiquitin transferase n=1 Tax=Gossypium stocksii TaxID=47602 RepID=A0A9D3W8T1_9ROSI|nr:hypothetical protein J1N35_008115 [Gossypium stocksii]
MQKKKGFCKENGKFKETICKLEIVKNKGKNKNDCIDVWLQNNANCPLYRTSISSSTINAPSLAPQDPISNGGDEDYVVIELGDNNNHSSSNESISGSPMELKDVEKRGRKLHKGTSIFNLF